MRMEIAHRTVFAATGGRRFEADRPAVVFLHGAGMDRSVWTAQARHFAGRRWSVAAVDLPGHGRSEGPPLASIAAMAGWVERLLDALGLERAALVGHSMGGLIALESAAALPARAARLALLGIGARMPVNPKLLATARADGAAAARLIASWACSRPDRRDAVLRLLERAAPGVLASDLAACDGYGGGEEAAARVACPTLLLLGAEDRMVRPSAADPLARRMARVSTVTLPGAGHMMTAEQPDAVTGVLWDFLSSDGA